MIINTITTSSGEEEWALPTGVCTCVCLCTCVDNGCVCTQVYIHICMHVWYVHVDVCARVCVCMQRVGRIVSIPI